MELDKEERRRLVAEAARKQLADGTWPELIAVISYPNPNAPPVSKGEFNCLKTFYQQAGCPNLALFVDLVSFIEEEKGVTMSFNFSMRGRLASHEASEPTMKNAALYLIYPDVLVGTRRGIEGAAVWLKNFSKVVATVAPESVQIMDKIFGEAVGILQDSSRKTTLGEMFESALRGTEEILQPPKATKH